MSRDPDERIRVWATSNPALLTDQLAQLSTSDDRFIRIGVAWNPNTSSTTLALFSGDADAEVRQAVEHRLQLPLFAPRTEGTSRLWPSPDWDPRREQTLYDIDLRRERLRVAFRSASDQERHRAVELYIRALSVQSLVGLTLKGAIADQFEWFISAAGAKRGSEVREYYANAAISHVEVTLVDEFSRRASDLEIDPISAELILQAVANDATGNDIGPPMLRVLKELASNPCTPAQVLEAIWRDWALPRAMATITTKHPGYELNPEGEAENLVEALVRNPNTPLECIRSYTRHTNRMVRIEVAKRAREPELSQLARDSEEYVRGAAATNPRTSPETLARLASDPSRVVRERVVGNPSTPVAILTVMVREQLRMLDRANAERKRREDLPSDLEDEIASVLANATYNPALPPETLDELARLGVGRYRVGGIAQNPNASPETLSFLGSVGIGFNELAENPRTPADTLRHIVDSASSKNLTSNFYSDKDLLVLLGAIAANPSSPPDAVELAAQKLSQLGVTQHGEFRLDSIQAPAGFCSALVRASQGSGGSSIAAIVARSLRTPTQDLTFLAESRFPSVRAGVSENSHTPVTTLMKLAEDQQVVVRAAAAGHPRLPAETLARLATDEHFTVRARVAGNSSTAPSDLASLALDVELGVRVAADGNRNIASSARLAGRLAAATDIGSDPPRLTILATDPEPSVRRAVSANPRTPIASLVDLAQDESPGVRRALAENPSADETLLDLVSSDPALFVPSWR